jgi:hypothetical protein
MIEDIKKKVEIGDYRLYMPLSDALSEIFRRVS